jgi:hypothetical protein
MKQQRLRLIENENRFADIEPEDLTGPEAESLMGLALKLLAARHKKGHHLADPGQ